MGKPLSMDLPSRTLDAIDGGMSCRAAAERFGVAPSTALRWHDQRRRQGHCAPKPQGGDTRSRRLLPRSSIMRRLLPTAKTTLHPAYGIEAQKGSCNLTRN